MDINIKNDTGDKNITFDINDINNDDIMGISLLADPTKLKENSDDGNGSIKDNSSYVKEDYNLFDTITEPTINKPEEGIKHIEQNKDITLNDNLIYGKNDTNSEFKSIQTMNSQDIKNEKIDLLYKFRKLEGQGIKTTMNYNMNSHLDDMRNEYIKLKKQREIDNSIKFQRKVMMAAITGLEFLNNKFDPLSIHLDGWSESVSENIYDYDEVFEELYEKYGGTTEVAPEIKLLMLLGGSAFMFHLTNTMFKTTMPGMGDIMKDNPELMKQFASAAMGNVMGGQPNQQPNQKPQMQQDMVGPDNIDEIINDMNLQPNNIDLDQISIMSDLSNGLTMDLS
tara:strand:- start:6919 stop:7932 length:1014 start_codon:yes stop_codon:yes gene_type:complete